MARAISRYSSRGCDRRTTRPGGPLRADRIHLPGLRDRPAGPAASPARRPHLARRPRIPRQRGGRHAGHDRRIGQQRPQTRARLPAAPTADGRRSRTAPASGSPSEDAIVAKFVRAYESADLDAVVALLTDDVFMSMPPVPCEYEGRVVVARFGVGIFGSGRRFDLVPTRANGQPAFGAYLRAPGGIRHATGLIVLPLTGDRICAMTRFENTMLPWFGLPRSLPSR